MKMISNNTEFEQIMAGDKPVVLDFYADWCGPCRALLPVLEEVGNDYAEDIVIAKINVEENPELATKFSVRSIPAVFLIKNGGVVDQFTGVQSRAEINKRIDQLISMDIEKTNKLNIMPG
ncbi:thioredoxin [Pedobacter antarcticus 4BY]|uniref:Thioredoxin n=2 Tax=Pedobacter antarcticus TaxID=34086 RepID=A0A081PE91_9SPHI|nr:thioredoxin [Pedobacter antarcticus]KEQ29014.1 thioredoxin [Pedobacter antarcticus 4BY]SFE30259.1 thioredoxin [Pedobacter antarcticus]